MPILATSYEDLLPSALIRAQVPLASTEAARGETATPSIPAAAPPPPGGLPAWSVQPPACRLAHFP